MPIEPMPLRLLVVSRAVSRLGYHEDPGAPNRGTIVRLSLGGCVRNGHALGLFEGIPWCAGFVGLCMWDEDILVARSWTPGSFLVEGDPRPVGWRASVFELVEDARATDTFVDVSELQERPAEPGDLLIMGRGGQDPRRRGNTGHVAVIENQLPDGFATVGGNEADPAKRQPDGVRRSVRRLGDRSAPIVGAILLGRGGAARTNPAAQVS